MRFGIFFLIFLLIVLGVFYYLTAWSYSDGERAGTVSKFSRRGFVFKTWEGILNVGGFSGETGSLTPQNFEFSVKDDSVAEQINQAVKTGQRITLHYEEKLVRLPWNGDTKYFITGAEIVNNPYQRPYDATPGFPNNQSGYPPQTPQQQQYPQQQLPQTQPQQQPQPNAQPAPIDTVLNGSI